MGIKTLILRRSKDNIMNVEISMVFNYTLGALLEFK